MWYLLKDIAPVVIRGTRGTAGLVVPPKVRARLPASASIAERREDVRDAFVV